MALDEKILKRFEELFAQGTALLTTAYNNPFLTLGGTGILLVNRPMAEQWGVSTLSFIGRIIGKGSEHYERFSLFLPEIGYAETAGNALAVLRAAQSDYKGGYLFEARKAIRAEVFDDFIEQADYFLGEGYFQVAALIAGSVLEDSMRQLCARRGLTLAPKPKLDTMNAELAKAGIYSVLIQKKVTWLADIRNKAAHGKWKEFSRDDSAEMVKAVRRFVEDFS